MHTAICTFDDPAQAEQAVNRLLQSGFDRHAVHMEHRHPDGSPMDDNIEHRDQDVKGKFSFFERLFGPASTCRTWTPTPAPSSAACTW
jgi:hypothetical protein